jgi:hypothetical protein
MAITVADLQTFTDAEILVVLRCALVNSALVSQYSIGGRQLIRMSAKQVQELIEVYEARIQSAANTSGGGNNALVQFGERV